MPEPPADGGLGDLPDQRQHRGVHAVSREQGGRRVEQARPRHDRIGLRLAGCERCAERHVSGTLLMARVDGANAVRGLEQRIKQMIVVYPGEGIDRCDAVYDERLDNGLCRSHSDGGRSLLALFR